MIEYCPGYWLAKNSEAYKLWEAGKKKELDAHIKQLKENAVDLMKRYEHLETKQTEKE